MIIEDGKNLEGLHNPKERVESTPEDQKKDIEVKTTEINATTREQSTTTSNPVVEKMSEEQHKISTIKKNTFSSNEVQKTFQIEELQEINQDLCKNNAHTYIQTMGEQYNKKEAQITQAKNLPTPEIKPLGTETPQDMIEVIQYFRDISTINGVPRPDLESMIQNLQKNNITEVNQRGYNNLFHILATGKPITSKLINQQVSQRELEEQTKTFQENFEKAKTPDDQIKVIQESIEATGEKLNKATISGALDKLMSGDISGAMKELGTFFAQIMNIIGGKSIDQNEKLFNIGKMDFSHMSIVDLMGDGLKKASIDSSGKIQKDDQWNITYEQDGWKKHQEHIKKQHEKISELFDENGNLQEEELQKNENSLYGKIRHKKQTMGLTQDIMYTTALSKIKDTIYAKYRLYQESNPKARDTELNDPTKLEEIQEDVKIEGKEEQYQKLSRSTKPGDLIFWIGGDKMGEDGKIKDASIFDKMLEWVWWPGNHVGIIGENGKLYHSTMKQYGTGRDGVHAVDLQTELNSRPNSGLIIARPHTWSGQALQKAQQAYQEKIGYDKTDAARSIIGKDGSGEDKFNNKDNCATFIDRCYPKTFGTQTGIPAEIMQSPNISLEYTMKRT